MIPRDLESTMNSRCAGCRGEVGERDARNPTSLAAA